MKYFIGIDLGTTNSAICSYDGKDVRIWKSPEQNDITPSAIFVDRRGNKFYGVRAYNQAPYFPESSATIFKRFMGTNTLIKLEASNTTLTPEECSAEILKVLFGYLPEEIRSDPETATVITVPAAFNQMKKDATLQAARLAGLGKVALMQEPVAAIMSVMRFTKKEGIFLVYDLGGGTFDVSVAENINNRVNLLAHGGIEMCGGRDIDRELFNKVVVPWLQEKFSLPQDFLTNRKYKTFCRIAQWATELAKIELSAVETSTIALSEGQARATDEAGNELFLDLDLTRTTLDTLISELIEETVSVTRETLAKAGLRENDVERIVFVGGPTIYKPLRDNVSNELSIPAAIEVNPMTAVAEGASIFAESIDWTTSSHNRKGTNKVLHLDIGISFKYNARSSAEYAKVMCSFEKPRDGLTIQFTSLDTGWCSGSAKLEDNLVIDLPLSHSGENRFSILVQDEFGNSLQAGMSEIEITKTLTTIGAIPSSHSIGVEVIDKLGGIPLLEFLVSEGDPLPKKGSIVFKAGQTLKAGSHDSINIKLWEGNIQSPITDNRFIGVLKITGTDIPTGIIPTGADIECDYEISDSGTIILEASIPCIQASFSNHNFYSRQEGQIDLSKVDTIADQGRSVIERIDNMARKIDDTKLENAREKAEYAANIDSQEEFDPEDVQKANNQLLEAKKLVNLAMHENLKIIRQMDLDSSIEAFEDLRKFAEPAEDRSIENLILTAQRSIDRNENDFDNVLQNLTNKIMGILLRQDWFIIEFYRRSTLFPSNYYDVSKFLELKRLGDQALVSGDINQLRKILFELVSIQIQNTTGDGMFEIANIVKG